MKLILNFSPIEGLTEHVHVTPQITVFHGMRGVVEATDRDGHGALAYLPDQWKLNMVTVLPMMNTLRKLSERMPVMLFANNSSTIESFASGYCGFDQAASKMDTSNFKIREDECLRSFRWLVFFGRDIPTYTHCFYDRVQFKEAIVKALELQSLAPFRNKIRANIDQQRQDLQTQLSRLETECKELAARTDHLLERAGEICGTLGGYS